MALTRASERVVVSAVLNDDNVPSDFLYGYMPECFDRDRDADMERREYASVGGQGDYAGLETDPRGLVAAARSVLASEPEDSPKARDAAEALALLASHGVTAATLTVGRLWGRRSRPPCEDRGRHADGHERHVGKLDVGPKR